MPLALNQIWRASSSMRSIPRMTKIAFGDLLHLGGLYVTR